MLYKAFKTVGGKPVFCNGHTTDQMYFLENSYGRVVDISISHFQDLIVEKNLKALYPTAYSLKRFWKFLEQNNMRWDEMPAE